MLTWKCIPRATSSVMLPSGIPTCTEPPAALQWKLLALQPGWLGTAWGWGGLVGNLGALRAVLRSGRSFCVN